MRAQVLTMLISMLAPFYAAPADDPVGVAPGSGVYDVIGSKARQEGDSGPPAQDSGDARDAGNASNGTQPKVRYAWRTACAGGIGNPITGASVCPVNDCPPGEEQYRLWRIAPGQETPMGLVCSG